MKNLLVGRKLIIGVVTLGVLFASVFFLTRPQTQAKQAGSYPQSPATTRVVKSSNNYSMGSVAADKRQDLQSHAAKMASLDSAKKALSYGFPVPAGYQGIYVENSSVLYFTYPNDIYVIIHKLPDNLDPKLADQIFTPRSGESTTTVRGQRATAAEPGPGPDGEGIRYGGSLGWFEHGLDIAIYSYGGASSAELRKIADSMKW